MGPLSKNFDRVPGPPKGKVTVRWPSRDYNPPRRNVFASGRPSSSSQSVPNADDPDACDVYRDLKFAERIYASGVSGKEG
jgi:hypothetical protein